MAIYHYKAYDTAGKLRKGTADEESRRNLLERLRQQGLTPIDITVAQAATGENNRQIFQFGRIKLNDIAMFTRQLSTLVGAGLPLVEALSATLEQGDQSKMTTVIAGVRDGVNEGLSFAEALRRHPRAFNDLYVNMVSAGEQSGALEVVLERLADFLDGQIELRNQLVGALAYPVIMFVAMMGIIALMFVFVIPKIVQIFDRTEQALPLPTQFLIWLSEVLRTQGQWIPVIAVVFFFLFRAIVRTERGKAAWHGIRIKLPILGQLTRNVVYSRFSRTLATLLSSGVPLTNSLKIVREVVGNVIYADAVDGVHDAVVEGEGLAPPLRRSSLFPPAMIRMIAAGEKSGDLEDMLGRVAMAYDREVRVRLTLVTRILEPVMILVMGGAVFFIMLSIMIPMFKINQLVG